MKKLASIFLILALTLGVVGVASAEFMTFNEEYLGLQPVVEGQSFNFGFDFWYDNDVYGVGTDAPLMWLTQDAQGADGYDLEYADLCIVFAGLDPFQVETADITVTAWDEFGNPDASFVLSTGIFNVYYGDPIYTYAYSFTPEQIDTFEEWGWGNVNIAASITPTCNYNDFAILKVGISAGGKPVPEPSTILLLGAGLIGLAAYGRKKIKK